MGDNSKHNFKLVRRREEKGDTGPQERDPQGEVEEASHTPSRDREIAAQDAILTGISADQTYEQVELEVLQQVASQLQETESPLHPLEENDAARREMLREWGFGLTPDPVIGYPMAPNGAVVEVVPLADGLLAGSSGAVESASGGCPAEDLAHSQMECESEESVIMGPVTLLGKRKKLPTGRGKFDSTEEEGDVSSTRRRKKTHRATRCGL